MSDSVICLACLVCLTGLVILAVALRQRRRGRDHFFTQYAQEEPTRSYTPYTGTVPVGPWGARPWGEAAPGPRRGLSDRAFLGPLDNAGL
jgi:hypothetical protein